MNFFLRISIVFCAVFLVQNLFGQFEKISIRNTSIEYEKDLIDDTSSTYVKLMLCGDLIHRKNLMNKYAPSVDGIHSYRSWFRQVKPLFFYPDFVVGSLRSFFPNRANMTTFPNSAPDEYLVELEYTGFNVMMMANSSALTDRKQINDYTLKKLEATDIFKSGFYRDSNDKKATFPLVLEKKGIRIAFLNYSLDSVLLDLPEEQINFFQLDSIRKDVIKARKTMMADYIVAYIDWAKQDSLKLGKVAELLNMGIDVIIGTGNGESFTNADLLAYSDGSLKLHIDNIGYFNAESNERDRNKTAVIEIVLKKNKSTKQVSTYDMGFIPIWTLIDHERYAVLPISNIEEKHIQNINLNLVQYSTMKVALTDLRYAFFDKIPELHYDFTDKLVSNVEQTAFIRKTLMREQDKINENIKQSAVDDYYNLFGSEPPATGSLFIPYEDVFGMYSKKTYHNIIPELKVEPNAVEKLELEKELKKNQQLKEKLELQDLQAFEKKTIACNALDSLLQLEFSSANHGAKGFSSSFLDSMYDVILQDYQTEKLDRANEKIDILRNWTNQDDYDSDLYLSKTIQQLLENRENEEFTVQYKKIADSLLRRYVKGLYQFQYKDPILKESAYNELFELLSKGDYPLLKIKISNLRKTSVEAVVEAPDKMRRIDLERAAKSCHEQFNKISESQNHVRSVRFIIDSLENILDHKQAYQRRIQHNMNVKKNIQKISQANQGFVRNRDTFELYGNNQDEISNRGIINIKSNSQKYTRDYVRIYTAREKFVMDSIRQYNERFIVIDSIAEMKRMIKQKKADSIRRRDSAFRASLKPNYRSSYNPAVDPSSTINPHIPKIQSGVFTQVELSKEDNLPVKNIEEYFLIQVYTFATQKEIDLDLYPYLSGYEVRYEDGFYRYYVGKTNSPKLAKELLKSIRAKGHPDAMLVKYTNGVRSVVKTNF